MRESLQLLFKQSMNQHNVICYRFSDPKYKIRQPGDFLVIGNRNFYLIGYLFKISLH